MYSPGNLYRPAVLHALLATAIVCLVLKPQVACLAENQDGCLTCHRFPGLVLSTEPGQLSVMHIDEEQGSDAPHHDLICKECHPQVTETPHRQDMEVNCTNSCHAGEEARIDGLKKDYATYHAAGKSAIVGIEHRSSCVYCHHVFPHKKNSKLRAILNMHSGHIHCQGCHLAFDNHADVAYTWGPSEVVEYIGNPYGNYESIGSKYALSRITISEWSGRPESRDLKQSVDFMRAEAVLSEDSKQSELEFFHRDTSAKERLIDCNHCHAEEGQLNFEALGYDPRRSKALRNLNITGWATKYDTFYFPKLW